MTILLYVNGIVSDLDTVFSELLINANSPMQQTHHTKKKIKNTRISLLKTKKYTKNSREKTSPVECDLQVMEFKLKILDLA